jgi:hypothetical protein
MNTNLTCTQVMALINYYIEGELNPTLKKYVDLHIAKCPHCSKKFEELKKILMKYDENNAKIKNHKNINTENNKLIKRLSAYIDNELNSDDNIKVKKMTISNPNARKKLESMYKFQKLMHSAYQKTKNEVKADYSKHIISIITDKTDDYTTTYFKKIIFLFFIILIAVITGFIYLYS